MVYPEKEIVYWKNESGTKDQNNELLGLECSTIQKRCGRRHIQTKKRSEAFEMWIWRRMEKISWLDKVTNEEVLRRINEDRQTDLLNSIL